MLFNMLVIIKDNFDNNNLQELVLKIVDQGAKFDFR